MFKAINTEMENVKLKIDLERSKIEQFYNDCLENKKYKEYFAINPVHDENQDLYETGKSNLLCHFIRESDDKELDKIMEEYNAFSYKYPMFEYIYKLLECREFEKVLDCLKAAEAKKWFCYEYYDIKDSLHDRFYNIGGCERREKLLK